MSDTTNHLGRLTQFGDDTLPLSPMFIEFEIRRGLVELHAQQVVRDRAEARNFGTRAGAIYRAGRKVWSAENLCIDCGHKDYDPEEYEIDCETPRCPKRQSAGTIHLVAKRNSL